MYPSSERACRPRTAAAGRAAPAALTVAALLAAAGASAQEDLSRPPRLSDVERPAEPVAAPPEGASQFDEIEEIVVVSDQNPWRLPDLGSSWRAQYEAAGNDDGRISVDLAPLWNPDSEEIPTDNPFSVGDDFGRVGFIEVFRVRFGRR